MKVVVGVGCYKDGRLSIYERWDIRELEEGIACFRGDAHDIDKLNEASELLLPTPVISSN